MFPFRIKHQAKNIFPSDIERTVAGNSHEMPRLIFPEKQNLNAVCYNLLSAIRVKTTLVYMYLTDKTHKWQVKGHSAL